MSKIEDLIKEKCPNGVKFEPLWKLTTWDKKFNAVDNNKQPKIIKYHYFLASDLKSLIVDGGDVKILTTNTSNLWTTEELAGETISDGEVVAIPWGGNPNIQYYNGKFITSDNRIATSNNTNILSNKFLYYYMNNKIEEIASYYRGSGIKHPNMSKVLDMIIPIPPLEVQNEIVQILDNFAELTAELTAELSNRKKQYEYYRDLLLNFDENNERERGVKWATFGDVCENVTDYVAAGSFADLAKHVHYLSEPNYAMLIRTMDIKNNYSSKNPIYITEDAYNYLWRVKLDGEESIILPNIGNCGEVYYIHDNLPYPRCALATNAILVRSSSVMNKFLFYLFQSKKFQKDLKKIVSPVGQTKFNKTDLKKILIPVPSLAEQEYIVSILNKFDALTSDLSSGLPAEIEARQKQYEYYRDKLLTFEEFTVNA